MSLPTNFIYEVTMDRIDDLNMVNFKGHRIRSVSCYTLLSGFQLPWPPSDCLYVLTPFKNTKPMVISLIITLGAFQSTVSAYQKRSTRRDILQKKYVSNFPSQAFIV